VTSRSRRDFLLDSGGVSALAANRDLLVAYLELLKLRLTGAPSSRSRSLPRSDLASDVPMRLSIA
jgi:hypothetical protein